METREALLTRRSVRKFKADKISHEQLQDIIDCACMAPSGTNLQPWYFVVLESEQAVENCRMILRKGAEKFRPALEKRFAEHPQVVEDTLSFMSSCGGAPAIVLAFMYKEQFSEAIKASHYVQSVAAAVENLLLAAWDKGIGSCWMTGILSSEETTAHLEKEYAEGKGCIVAAIALGYPDEDPKAPKRKAERVKFL